MTSEDKDKKKRRRWWDDDSFDDQFDALQSMFEELMKMFSDIDPEDLFGTDSQEQIEEILEQFQKNPMVWGFSASLGPDGKIQLNPFGNLNPEGPPPVVSDTREPLIDVMEQDEDIILIAELPGIKEKDLDIAVSDYTVTIQVNNPERKYAKTIDLPAPVQINSAKSNYNNGILEIKIKKR
ncbi:MAG: archaeal heat shock protein Hsp20 [Candidatus Hermodarchaeia archaeon]|jgi:HSP20 family protein